MAAAGTRWVFRRRWGETHKTAFGVFFRFQVTDFDAFLFLVSHFWFSFVGLFVVCGVSVAPKST